VTLAELAVTVGLLGALGLVASRFGMSAIPAYLLAGLLLGPNEPTALSLIRPSEVTEFVAELGIVFLLFFLGLEFSLGRLLRSGRHVLLGGTIDLIANWALGLAVGVAVFGFSLAAVILAACIHVSSSAIIVKALTDFRRLGDDETDLILAILVFEDIAIAFVLGFAAGAGGGLDDTAEIAVKATAFIAVSLAMTRWLAESADRLLDRLDTEFLVLAVVGFAVGMAAVADRLGLSEAIGALMAGVVLAETSARGEIEERFFSVRDLFGALFFFVFGLSIDIEAAGELAVLLIAAVAVTMVGKIGAGMLAGRVGGFSPRRSLNVGCALVAHGEFTVIIAQLASGNEGISAADRADLVAFAGLYVLATATLGVLLMKESKEAGRRLWPAPRLRAEKTG
jgi:CPA2 family monovalent cation:H+ antiporter-2